MVECSARFIFCADVSTLIPKVAVWAEFCIKKIESSGTFLIQIQELDPLPSLKRALHDAWSFSYAPDPVYTKHRPDQEPVVCPRGNASENSNSITSKSELKQAILGFHRNVASWTGL